MSHVLWFGLRALHRYNHGLNTLVFESRFESGNLRRAIRVGEHEYCLLLRGDLKSIEEARPAEQTFTQWFYFSVSNTRAKTKYIFHFTNCLKEQSLYEKVSGRAGVTM